MTAETIAIRKCQGIVELEACVALQKEVWNFADADLIPLRLFVVAEKIGGQALGAFDGGALVGFALAIPGARCGHAYLHSHMLAVRESYRNRGLGRKLKLAQRDDALARGFQLIEWTFDPLEIKNAFLNVERLGAVARRYNQNQYGMSSSPLQGGLPTDRLVAEWWLGSRRVWQALRGERPRPEGQIATSIAISIPVPAEVYRWKASPELRERARELQLRVREAFLSGFSQGLAVLGYERDALGNGKFLLGEWDEEFSYGDDAEAAVAADKQPVVAPKKQHAVPGDESIP
jgi:predicted GNAT superfamily acetyltransferase